MVSPHLEMHFEQSLSGAQAGPPCRLFEWTAVLAGQQRQAGGISDDMTALQTAYIMVQLVCKLRSWFSRPDRSVAECHVPIVLHQQKLCISFVSCSSGAI